MEKTTEEVKKRELHAVALLVESNNHAARKFYESLGFKEGHHFIWMEKRFKMREEPRED